MFDPGGRAVPTDGGWRRVSSAAMSPWSRRGLAHLAIRAAPASLGAVWAGALVVLGLWVIAGARGVPAGSGRSWIWGGALMVAAGQFVFMVVVADWLCPPRRPMLAHVVEAAAAIATVCSGLALAFSVFEAGQ